MPFIFILALAATMLAGSAAYFSVYGLAVTFSGAFWAVVVMGASLEAGKLVAASYLYRYWDRTSLLMKSYLVAGIIAVMGLTSVGVFGYLSAGYQAEVLPLKQMQERVTVLEQERNQVYSRKQEIDDQIAKASVQVNVNQSNGRIDPRAVATLRQAEAARKAQVATLEPERQAVMSRLASLDKELLDLKTQRIHHEAKIGPIMYIAEVFGLPADNATKYLIFLIIFAFDPMAVVLTLAVNIALKYRKEDLEKRRSNTTIISNESVAQPPKVNTLVHQKEQTQLMNREEMVELLKSLVPVKEQTTSIEMSPVLLPPSLVEQTEQVQDRENNVNTLEVVDEFTQESKPERQRVFTSLIPLDDEKKIDELVTHYRDWLQQLQSGKELPPDVIDEMRKIRQFVMNTRWHYKLENTSMV